MAQQSYAALLIMFQYYRKGFPYTDIPGPKPSDVGVAFCEAVQFNVQ